MSYVGAASGAALGYIVGNVPGAVVGSKLGYVAGSRKRFWSYGGHPSSSSQRHKNNSFPNMSRRGSNASHMSVSTRRSSSIGTPRRWLFGTPRHPSVLRRRPRLIRRRGFYKHSSKKYKKPTLRTPGFKKPKKLKTKFRKKKVRFSKKFKARVRKVINLSKGTAFVTMTGWEFLNTQPDTNKQMVTSLPAFYKVEGINASGTHVPVSGFLFSPTWFLHCASLMWYGAGAPNGGPATQQSPISSGMLPWRNTKFPVIKSWARYCIKNNTVRPTNVKMYVCKPKFKGTLIDTNGQVQSPQNCWDLAIAAGGFVENSTGNSDPVVSTPYIINAGSGPSSAPYQVSSRCYKEDPRHLPYWRSRWSCDVTTFKIEPGQCIPVIVKGPADQWLDYNKFQDFADTANPVDATSKGFEDIQKFTRHVMFVYYHDATSYNNGTNFVAGVPLATETTADGQGLVIEENLYCKIGMPDVVMGLQTAGVPLSQWMLNNGRVDKYGNFVFSSNTSVTAVVEVTPGGVNVQAGG